VDQETTAARLHAERRRVAEQVEALQADFDTIVAASEYTAADDEHDPAAAARRARARADTTRRRHLLELRTVRQRDRTRTARRASRRDALRALRARSLTYASVPLVRAPTLLVDGFTFGEGTRGRAGGADVPAAS
jgi:hypothetical protein